MNFRSFAVLLVLPTLIGGLLISSPAEAAAKKYATVSTNSVAINASGVGRVYLRCSASKTCKGKVSLPGGGEQKYAVAAKKAAYVFVKTSASGNPANGGTPMPGGYLAKPSTLTVDEDSPSNVTHSAQAITTETPVRGQVIVGTVKGEPGTPIATGVEVELWQALRGGVQKFLKSDPVANNGSFAFAVPLGANNSASAEYELRITGTDDKGEFRAWWWRGLDDAPRGGGKYFREAAKIKATKSGEYTADFNYGSIAGTVRREGVGLKDVEVTVAGAPMFFSDTVTDRELDFPGCANNFAQRFTDNAGNYEIGFLPYNPNAEDKRYLVLADAKPRYPSTELLPLWNDEYGSCANAMGYAKSRNNLLNLQTGAINNQDFALRKSDNTIHVNAGYSGFTPTSKGDRFVRIREKVSGVGLLNSPIIAQGTATSSGIVDFTNLPRGAYWVEVGRRTGCSAWVASRYPNNNLYLQGADRGAERWKTVAGTYAEYQKSKDMGFVAKKPPKGYKGWAYRELCVASGAGSYSAVAFNSTDGGVTKPVYPTVKRGATVKGHVKRGGGRTNKEILVRIYSRGSTLVLRTALTNGSGNFSVSGLASGSYTVTVNPDSWRGISRRFSGRHTIKVTAGHSYSVGTLNFQNEADKGDSD